MKIWYVLWFILRCTQINAFLLFCHLYVRAYFQKSNVYMRAMYYIDDHTHAHTQALLPLHTHPTSRSINIVRVHCDAVVALHLHVLFCGSHILFQILYGMASACSAMHCHIFTYTIRYERSVSDHCMHKRCICNEMDDFCNRNA